MPSHESRAQSPPLILSGREHADDLVPIFMVSVFVWVLIFAESLSELTIFHGCLYSRGAYLLS